MIKGNYFLVVHMLEDGEKSVEKKKNNLNGYDSFKELVLNCKKKIALFTHRCPDPDAMASMMGLQWLLSKSFNIASDLFYDGEVSHPQNNALVNLLDPGLKRVNEEYNQDLYDLNILLDTIPENAGIGKHVIKFDAYIDHHKDLSPNFPGIVIHKKVGSCSGIVFDMMKHFVKKEDWLTEHVDHDAKIATSLIAGIVTDTEYMMSDDSTEYEFKAFSELFPFRDPLALKQIVFFKRPKFWIEKLAIGASEAEINEDGNAIVGLGLITEKQRDIISAMSEEMVTWNSVETAIAFAVVNGDRIEGSVRSFDSSIIVTDLCKKLAGKHGTGGGKRGKGAYRLPLAGLSICLDEEEEEDINEAWNSIKTRETKRILRMFRK